MTIRPHGGHLSILIHSITAPRRSNRHSPTPCLIFYTGASSYEIGSSSQIHEGTQDMCETAARNHGHWPTFSSFFEGIDQFIPTRPSSQTPVDLGLSLSPSAMQAPPLQSRHSVSHLDTAGSAFRHYDPDVMQGRRLFFADDTPQEEPQGTR
ncbi:hypothetical protein PIB30_079293 [Stylosanthes scabra]|uniref:Uncharacterized protein n=1 Tax=Stylosanthes scabra TaxID=79078 RepID=A0ABU6RRE0_9FABA|nr:hypothetical protein [Stylosanthes scabra]